MLLEKNQIGKREDLADYITRVDAKSKPFLAMVPKEKELTNTRSDFQMDDFEEPEDNAYEDGKDVDTFDNASPNRALASVYCQKFMDSAMVSDFAENVSDVAGASKGELALSIMKKLEKISRDIEAALCSDNDTQQGGAGIPYKLRGLGSYISSSAQATLPIDANYLTPAASIDATAMASITDDTIAGLIQSSYEQTGVIQDFAFLCGPTLKRQFGKLTQIQKGSTNVMGSIVVYNRDLSERKISTVIDRYEGDFGEFELHPTLFNAKFTSAAAVSRRGYGLIPKYTALRYKRMPRVKQLEDRGGGPRFLVDAICTLIVKNPKPFIKMNATT